MRWVIIIAIRYRLWGLIAVETQQALRKTGHAVWRSLVMYGWTLYPYGPCPCLPTEARDEP